MKVTYRTEKLDIEVDGDTMQDVFKNLAMMQDVFGDLNCYWDGKVSSETAFKVRINADGDEFYELWYVGSDPHFFGCKKQMGCYKLPKGGLFVKHKDGEGNLLSENIYKNHSWTKWDKESGKLK